MKKFFRKALVLIAILGMGTGVTSCDEDTITVIASILQQLMGGNSQSYVGSADLVGLKITDETDKDGSPIYLYLDTDSVKTVNNMQVNITVQNQQASITIPTVNVGGRTLQNIQVGGIAIDQNGTMEGDGTLYIFSCSRDINGRTENIVGNEENINTTQFALFSGSVVSNGTNSAVLKLNIQITIEGEIYQINYNGSLAQQQQ